MASINTVNTDSLPILYRDEALVAINKPAGLLVHRSPIDRHETRFAIQLLRDQLGQWVYPLHRLDKPTSGVLLFALSPTINSQLAATWQRVEKQYLAIVRGHAPTKMLVDHPIRHEPDQYAPRTRVPDAQPAQTLIRQLAQTELPYAVDNYSTSRYSLVLCNPLTGRRHQLRRHLKHISHPIIGDAKHGKGKHNRFFAEQLQAPGLMLCATRLTLHHPASGEQLVINAGVSPAMQALIHRFNWHDAVPREWQLHDTAR